MDSIKSNNSKINLIEYEEKSPPHSGFNSSRNLNSARSSSTPKEKLLELNRNDHLIEIFYVN